MKVYCINFLELPPDLNCLMLTLKGSTVSLKWYSFGLALGVPKDFLENLKEHPDNNNCLVEVLDYWLRNHSSQPTWKEVMDAQKIIVQ